MASVVWRREALDDLRGIIRYIAQFDPTAAQGFGVRLYALGQGLEDFPRRGRPLGGHRRELTTEPPFVLSYEVVGDEVFILSIRHGRQAP